MDQPCVYEIRVEGFLAGHWSDWFDGLVIRREAETITILTGCVPDQSALFGLLAKIRDLNLILLSINRQNPLVLLPGDTSQPANPPGRT